MPLASSVRPAAFTEPGFSSLPVGLNGPIRLTVKASLLTSSNWRRGRDSNPRYLAVHCISNAARSTTLPPLLCYQLEGASKGGQGVGQGRRKSIIRGPEAQRLGGTDDLRPRGRVANWHGMTAGHSAYSGQPSLRASFVRHFATALAQESLRPTVRLKTGLPGWESLASAQK